MLEDADSQIHSKKESLKREKEMAKQSEKNQKVRIVTVQFNKINQTIGHVYCLEPGTNSWNKYYAVIKDSCLQLYHELTSDAFKI